MGYKLAVFDWAGTVIDYGSFAPMNVFVETFKHFGVTITVDQARGPMGLPKRDHIAALLKLPGVEEDWIAATGEPADEQAIDKLYAIFIPANVSVAAQHAKLVPGALDAMSALQAQGIRLASTTGYTRAIMQEIIPVAAAQGYEPEAVICSDDLIAGRPSAHGVYQCMINTGVASVREVIKVDDTAPGIQEGVNAGCLTVGVAMSGNAVGLSPEDVEALSPEHYNALRNRAAVELFEAGADHVIDSVADLPDLLARLDCGATTP